MSKFKTGDSVVQIHDIVSNVGFIHPGVGTVQETYEDGTGPVKPFTVLVKWDNSDYDTRGYIEDELDYATA